MLRGTARETADGTGNILIGSIHSLSGWLRVRDVPDPN